MSADKHPKPIKSRKSETLEVRIPYETKQAFLTARREDGTTASEVVHESVQTYLDERERPPIQKKRSIVMKFPAPVRHYAPRIAAGAVAALGLATFVALPSAAAPDFKAQFNRFDANGDGVLSADEFLGRKNAGTGKGDNNVVIETRMVTRSEDNADTAKPDLPPQLKQQAFAFSLPEEIAGAEKPEHQEFNVVARRELKDSGAAQEDSRPLHSRSTMSASRSSLPSTRTTTAR